VIVVLTHQITSGDPAISQSALLQRCLGVTKCKAFEPVPSLSEREMLSDAGFETLAPKRIESTEAEASDPLSLHSHQVLYNLRVCEP
jgi:hypothetical protein